MSYNYRRPRVGGCISGIVVLLLIIGSLIFVLNRAHSGVTLSVGPNPTIIGSECGGTIIIQTGPANQVVLSGVFPQYDQSTSLNTIELTSCDNGMTITVPPHADVEISGADSVTAFGVSGTLKLDVNGGRITLINCTLEGQSKIDDNGGVITFSGSLAQRSTSSISGNGGSIDMTLPTAAAFHLDVSGIFGPVVSDYTGVQAPADSGDELHVDVGHPASGITLTLDVNDTSLVLSKAN
jgi:hypothetical protein